MDLIKYLSALFVFIVNSDAGGHGEKHHDHVKVHVPEFIHHDHHTKVITIHHHHHKPKKEHHHHHHHHHQKPHIPHGHHYHHQKKSTTHVSKGHSSHHGSHGHHGHKEHHGHHGHHSHHGHHGHHGHEHKHHDIPSYDPPSVSYSPPSVSYSPPSVSYSPPAVNYEPPQVNYPSPSYGHDHSSFVPSPRVHGVEHTIKQVKFFDSLPGALPGVAGKSPSQGYEVNEEGEENENDIFTAVNTLSQTYPGSYGYVKSAAANSESDPFADISQQSTASSPNHDPFSSVAQPSSYGNIEGFTSQNDAFSTSIPTQGAVFSSAQPNQFSGSSAFDDPSNNIVGDTGNTAYFSSAEEFSDDTPVSFNREAGIQQNINTGGLETLVY